MASRHANNNLYYTKILEALLEYCLRLGKFLLRMDSLEQVALSNVIVRLWKASLTGNEERKLVAVCDNLLTSHFDEE